MGDLIGESSTKISDGDATRMREGEEGENDSPLPSPDFLKIIGQARRETVEAAEYFSNILKKSSVSQLIF